MFVVWCGSGEPLDWPVGFQGFFGKRFLFEGIGILVAVRRWRWCFYFGKPLLGL
ncbi:hypothetical protein GIB67_040254 [Kingdonia uniflora]|uniref:Uncharacterized protein n=1 Tax=Kingdonia uniflora TaxID=39325 RepID=A0A7J7MVD1_9MAGN|nr:hypothetical protein GIB67_040254 [Kingdonia uniflora]